MKKLSIGDMMSYWGIEYVKQSSFKKHSCRHPEKYEAKKDNVFGLGNTPLEAVHILVSALKASKA